MVPFLPVKPSDFRGVRVKVKPYLRQVMRVIGWQMQVASLYNKGQIPDVFIKMKKIIR